MAYMSAAQAAEKWGISTQRVRVLCQNDRIEGLLRVGNEYLIPSGALKPSDARKTRHAPPPNDSASTFRQSEAFRTLEQCFDNSPEGFCLIEPDTRRLAYANQTVRSLWGENYAHAICYRYFKLGDEPCAECPLPLGKAVRSQFRHQGRCVSGFSRPIEIDGQRFWGVTGVENQSETPIRTQSESAAASHAMATERFSELFDAVPAALAVFRLLEDGNLLLITVNRTFCERYGFRIGSLDGRRISTQPTFVHPDERNALFAAFTRAYQSKRAETAVFRMWDRSAKTYHWLRMTLRANDERDASLAFADFADVTQEHDTLRSLREHKALLEEAETRSNIHYIDYDALTGVAKLGRHMVYAFGLASELLSDFPEPMFRPDILHPDDYGIFREKFEQVKRGECAELCFDARVWNRFAKRYGYRREYFNGSFDENGTIRRITTTSLDIDACVRVETCFRQALLNNHVLLWEYDAGAHSGVLYLDGAEPQELRSDSIFLYDLLHPSTHEAAREIESGIRGGGLHYELRTPLRASADQPYGDFLLTADVIHEVTHPELFRVVCTACRVKADFNDEKQG